MNSLAETLAQVLKARRLEWSAEDRALVERCLARAIDTGIAATNPLLTATRSALIAYDLQQVKAQAANVSAAAAQDLAAVLHATLSVYLSELRGFLLSALGALA